MTRAAIRTVSSVAVLLATSSLALAEDVRTGKAAYGDWQTDAPGVMRKITVNDLAAPLETPPTANTSRVVAKPASASLATMPGFTVAPFATGMGGARVIRVAPNGDIFVARSGDGRVMVLRAKPGADKPDVVETFASGLRQPYGIAFYPPGPDPKWVYVAGTSDIVRYPYQSGDLKASGPAQTVVSDLPTGGSHWTRDIAFSPDGKTMYVSVGLVRQRRRRHGCEARSRRLREEPCAGRRMGPRRMARRCARLRSRRQEQARLRDRHPQLLGPRGAAGHRHRVLRDQRARSLGRQPAA